MLADLYAGIKTLDKLEKQYIKDNIDAKEYEIECRKRISQCRTSHDAVKSRVRPPLPENLPFPFSAMRFFFLVITFTPCFVPIRLSEYTFASHEREDVSHPRATAIFAPSLTSKLTHSFPVAMQYPTIASFIEAFSMTCSSAAVRLERAIPATLEHADSGMVMEIKDAVRRTSDVTESMIGLMDTIKVYSNACTRDVLDEPLNIAIASLNKAAVVVPDFKERETLLRWKARLSTMHAVDRLEDNEVRQMLMEVDSVYGAFKQRLP